MIKQNAKPEKSKLPIPLIIVASVIVVLCVVWAVSNKVQQSDPTLTKAPPPSSKGQVLGPSAGKGNQTQPMFTITASGGMVRNAGPVRNAATIAVGGFPTPGSMHQGPKGGVLPGN